MKIFSAGEIKATSWITNAGPNTNAYYIYPVTNDSGSNTVLLTSRNYLLPTKGNGPALVAGTKPFGDLGAIVVKKNGTTLIITPRQATHPVSSIGIVEGAPLN